MLSSGTPGSCSSVVFLPLECGCNCAKCLRLHCRPCSTGCPQSLEASGQGDSWVLSLGFSYGMYSVTNICTSRCLYWLPWLSLKRGAHSEGPTQPETTTVHSHLLALTQLHRRNPFIPEQNSSSVGTEYYLNRLLPTRIPGGFLDHAAGNVQRAFILCWSCDS